MGIEIIYQNHGYTAHAAITHCWYVLRGEFDQGVPVAFLGSSSASLSCLKNRLKNPASFSFESLVCSEFVLLETLGPLLSEVVRKCKTYVGTSCVRRAVVSPSAVANCSSRLRS